MTLCMSGAVAANCSDSPWKEAGWGHHVGESELALSLLAQHQDVWLSKGPCGRRKPGTRKLEGVASVLRCLSLRLYFPVSARILTSRLASQYWSGVGQTRQ